MEHLFRSVKRISEHQIKKTDQFVILDAEDVSGLIKNLRVPALALRGKEDYLDEPP